MKNILNVVQGAPYINFEISKAILEVKSDLDFDETILRTSPDLFEMVY